MPPSPPASTSAWTRSPVIGPRATIGTGGSHGTRRSRSIRCCRRCPSPRRSPPSVRRCPSRSPRRSAARDQGMTLVYLVVPQPRYTAFDAHYFPPGRHLDLATVRAEELPRRRRPDRSHRAVCRAAVPTSRCGLEGGPAATGLDRVPRSADRAGLGHPWSTTSRSSASARSIRWSFTDRAIGAGRSSTWSTGSTGVTMLGRQGLLVVDNLHHVMDMALSATACLGTDGGWDSRRWANERQRFDSFVVDD